MKAELSAEEIVTNLISSNEILKSKSYSKNELYDIKYRFIRKCDSWD